MERALDYEVMRDPDGLGWLVVAEGYTARSLPYGTLDEAVAVAEDLVRHHPGSSLVVTDLPRELTRDEIEHRIAA